MLKINSLLISVLLIMIVLDSNAKIISFKAKSLEAYVIKECPRTQITDKDSSIAFLKTFFKWYKTNFEYLDHHIYPVKMDLKNHTPYRINFNETEKYLSILKSSAFFSDDYINFYRAYFKKIDVKLQKTKQNDWPVDELDYDLIVHSQEPESILQDLNIIKLTLIRSKPKETIIKMLTPYDQDTYLLFHLKTINGKYLIDKVDFLIAGKIQNK